MWLKFFCAQSLTLDLIWFDPRLEFQVWSRWRKRFIPPRFRRSPVTLFLSVLSLTFSFSHIPLSLLLFLSHSLSRAFYLALTEIPIVVSLSLFPLLSFEISHFRTNDQSRSLYLSLLLSFCQIIILSIFRSISLFLSLSPPLPLSLPRSLFLYFLFAAEISFGGSTAEMFSDFFSIIFFWDKASPEFFFPLKTYFLKFFYSYRKRRITGPNNYLKKKIFKDFLRLLARDFLLLS